MAKQVPERVRLSELARSKPASRSEFRLWLSHVLDWAREYERVGFIAFGPEKVGYLIRCMEAVRPLIDQLGIPYKILPPRPRVSSHNHDQIFRYLWECDRVCGEVERPERPVDLATQTPHDAGGQSSRSMGQHDSGDCSDRGRDGARTHGTGAESDPVGPGTGAKRRRGGQRKPASETIKDIKLYRDWLVSGTTKAEFIRARNLDKEEGLRAIDRGRKHAATRPGNGTGQAH